MIVRPMSSRRIPLKSMTSKPETNAPPMRSPRRANSKRRLPRDANSLSLAADSTHFSPSSEMVPGEKLVPKADTLVLFGLLKRCRLSRMRKIPRPHSRSLFRNTLDRCMHQKSKGSTLSLRRRVAAMLKNLFHRCCARMQSRKCCVAEGY